MPFFLGIPEQTSEGTMFSWDASYDFDDEEIRYTFEVAEDYLFQNVISTQKELLVPQAYTEELPPGQYFYRVTAVNESGMTQTAMETYESIEGVKYYGVVCFYIQLDGSVVWAS